MNKQVLSDYLELLNGLSFSRTHVVSFSASQVAQ